MENINNFDDKWVSLKTLDILNEESVKRGYNRNLYMDIIENKLKEGIDKNPRLQWRGLDTQVLLIPLMIHEHKNCEPCEPHIRTQLCCGGHLGGNEPLLDIPIEMFLKLESIPKRKVS